MLHFIGKKLSFILVVCVLIVFFSYMGMHMIANSDLARPNWDVVDHGRYAWRATWDSLSGLARGDLGSVHTERGPVEVKTLLGPAFINSLGLLFVSLACATVVGVGAGMLAALVKNEVAVLPLLLVTVLGISMPAFFAGLLLQIGELYYLRLFGRPLVRLAGFGWDLEHMLLPVLVLAARPVAYLTRTTYVSLQHVMAEDYVRTAFSKGLVLRQAVVRHALRNMAVPILTAIGVAVRFSLGALPVVEFLFAWPGLGRTLLTAIDGRQSSFVVVLALVLGLTFLLTELALDVVYRIVDPRLRAE